MKRLFIIACCVGIVFVCGCDACSRDVRDACDKVSSFRAYAFGHNAESHLERDVLLKELRGSILSVSNRTSRLALARVFASLACEIPFEMKEGNGRCFQREIEKFKECFDAARLTLVDAGVGDQEYVEYFLKGMDKLLLSCLAVHQDDLMDGEGEQDLRKGYRIVSSIMVDYDEEINLWHDLVRPRLKKLPANFQSAPLNRWKEFLEYSHAEMLRDAVSRDGRGPSGRKCCDRASYSRLPGEREPGPNEARGTFYYWFDGLEMTSGRGFVWSGADPIGYCFVNDLWLHRPKSFDDRVWERFRAMHEWRESDRGAFEQTKKAISFSRAREAITWGQAYASATNRLMAVDVVNASMDELSAISWGKACRSREKSILRTRLELGARNIDPQRRNRLEEHLFNLERTQNLVGLIFRIMKRGM